MKPGLCQTISSQEFRGDLIKFINIVKKTKEPLYLLRNNKPEAVVLDVGRFTHMNGMARKAEEADTLEAIRIYEQEKKAGKLKTVKSLKELI